MEITESDLQEIVAIRIDGIIYFGKAAIEQAIWHQWFDELINRARFKFMASMDLGYNWERGAEAPTLFLLKDGKPYLDDGDK